MFDLLKNNIKNKKKKDILARSEIARQYQNLPSFSDYLPWLEWSDKHDLILLEDARSLGAVYEIKAVSTEARPQQQIELLHKKLVRLLSTLLPLEDENPWVMQVYVQDDLTLQPIYKYLEKYAKQFHTEKDVLCDKYLSIMKSHFDAMCKEEGIFEDPMSELKFRGKIRRIRVCLYRRYSDINKSKMTDVVDEINHVCHKFESQVQQIGIRVNRLKAEHFYDWLVRWFNPNPSETKGSVDDLLNHHPYPKKKVPFGWSFSQNIFFGDVESNDEGWVFDGLKHKILVFKDLDSEIEIGAISRELNLGENKKYAVIDKFPPGAVYTIQITFESKVAVCEHLDNIEAAAIGKSSVVEDIHGNIQRARYEIDNGNMLFRCAEAIYFSGKSDADLKKIELDLKPLLADANLTVVDTKKEIFPKDLYLRFLPFNFNYQFDKKHNFRSSYKYADDISRLLPFYGRSQGDGQNPLHIYYNRGGEVFMFDHLSRDFKMTNSHMAIVGTTGAGKSVVLNNMCLSMSAIRNPRIIAIEVGGSFDLTPRYLKQYGRNVKIMKFNRVNPIAVNPYAEAYKALETIEKEEVAIRQQNENTNLYHDGLQEAVLDKYSQKLSKEISELNHYANDDELECEEDRDILNEMVLATRVMITQGSDKEEEKIDPTDLSLITRALIQAMKNCKKEKKPQVLLSDVIASMNLLASVETNPDLAGRLKQYSLRLEYYTSGIRGQFINRPSEPLGDFDFMHIDFGFMQNESYKDLMNIVCISLLAKVLALAESNKTSGRPTELFIDEAHVFFKSSMVSAFIILMSKVARKIGLWLKPCTQNIEDFRGIESKKVLSMMETWLCLSLEAHEVALIEKFKPLTDEMRSLILDVRKYPGIYSEGVLLGKRYSGLFRNIPPRIALSLAMTEQDERTRRREIQEKNNMTEIEAVECMADEIGNNRYEQNDEKYFFY